MRKQLWKRVSALVLALVMVASSLPLDTLIANAEEAALVNIATDESVTVTTQDNHSTKANINNGVYELDGDSAVKVYDGPVNNTNPWGTAYKAAHADVAAPKNVPWIEIDLGAAKENIKQIMVHAATENSGNYKYQCTVYGKADDSAWSDAHKLNEAATLTRAASKDNAAYTLELDEAKTLRYVLVTLDIPSDWTDCWPILSEIEVYQRQVVTDGGEEGGETPEQPDTPNTNEKYENIAADCEITVPSAGRPADNMVDGDPATLWAAADGTWPSELNLRLPADNTRKVKKVVVKFEENHDAWSVDVKLQHALNNITSDLVLDNEAKDHSFANEYVYEYPTALNFTHTYITLSNPKNNGAAGAFWPAIAEVEIWVENEQDDTMLMNVAPSATITSIGGGSGAALIDDDYGSLYGFYNGSFSTGEAWIELALDREYPVQSMEAAFENMGTSDPNNFEFTFSVLGKDSDDTEWTPLFTNVTATRLSSNCVKELPLTTTKNLKYVRFVLTKITKTGGDPWPALAEFKVFADVASSSVEDTKSIAYGKPVHSNVNSDTVSRVNDGSVTNVWSGSRYPAYIDIDLEENYNLSEIQVFTPAAGYSQYSIYTSMDGRDFTKLAEKTSKDSCPEEGEIYDATGTEARIVRVYVEYQSTSTKSLVNEIRVLGTSSNTPVQSRMEIDIPTFEESEYNVEITAQDTYDEVYGIIERQVGKEYKDWFTLELAENPKAGHDYDYYELSTVDGKVHVKGNDGVSLATGINYFLKYYCQVNISQVGNQVNMPETIPAIDGTVFKETKAAVRYSYNYCTLSYSMAFYGEEEWRNELDWLALNGVNVVLDATAQEEVWRRFLTELGYKHAEIKDFIAGPAYYAWAYMANLSGFGGPVHDSWFSERTELARKNQLAMRKLGMQPVLQGYSGMVPNDIQKHDADAVIIKQGTWCSFQRPDMLKTDDPCFVEYAEKFYAAQKEVYGDVSDYYATDPFHEGGNTGGMNAAVISKIVLEEMIKADADSIWIIQAWQGNPSTALLNGLDNVTNGPAHALILDLYAEKDPHNQQTGGSYGDTKEFDDTPWLYCMLNNFGGRLGMHGHLDNMATKIPEALNNAKHMAGIGITPEASVNNPVLYEFIFETIWQDDATEAAEVIDLDTWLDDYATRRYGAESEAANQAWDILKETTYKASMNMLGQGAPESVVNARPALSIGAASTWGNAAISYDKVELEKAAELLLEDYDTLKDSEGYLYDVATVLQQVLSNSAQEYQRKMAAAFSARDLEAFDKYAETFMNIIADMETVTSTSEYYLLGRWVEMAKALGKNADDFTKELYEFNAKALITTWGSYDQAESGGLKDYSNRQWSGLINDYYKARWERWIIARHNELAGKDYERSINWFEWEWSWARGNTVYTTTPTEADLKTLGLEIIDNYTSFNQASVADDDISVDKITDVYAENYQPNNTTEGDPIYVLDGDANTHWHTRWSDTARDTHYIIFTLDEVTEINGMRLLQRNATNGLLSKIDILVREDESGEWTIVVDDAVLDATASTWNRIDFDAVNAKQVKLQVVDAKSGDGSKYAAAAEVRFTAPKEETPEDCKHTNTEEVPAVEATCTTSGTTAQVVCSDCGHKVSGGEKINALGHDWSEWTVVEEATTEKAGKEERTCQRTGCDEKEEKEIPKLNKPGEVYAFDSAILAENAKANSEQLPAAWTDDGGAEWAFTDNDSWWHSRYQDWDQMGDHEVGSTSGDGKPTATNPIWIQTGFDKEWMVDHITYVPRPNGHGIINEYEVSVANLADPTAEPTDADFTVVKTGTLEMVTTEQTIRLDEAVAATHVRITVYDTYDGYIGGVDHGDGHVAAKRIMIYGYDAVTVDPETCEHETTKVVGAAAATCTEAGYTGDTVCAACGEMIREGTEIPAAGHTEVTVAGKEATCTETGLTKGTKCSVCEEILEAQEVIPAKGHGTTELVGKVDATCTTAGNTGSEICKVCGKVVKVGAVINALGHDFPETWTVVKEATTEEEGLEKRQCSRCDETEERPIAKLEKPGEPDEPTTPPVVDEEEDKVETSKVAYNSLSLKWSAVAEAESYKVAVYAADNMDTPVKVYEGIEATNLTVSGLKEKTEYVVKVYAVNKLGESETAMELNAKTSAKPTSFSGTSSTPTTPSAPATGDTANIVSLVVMMAAAVCVVLMAKRRKA